MIFRVRPRNGRAIIEKKRRGKAPRREVDNTMRLENGRFLMQVEEKGAEITSLYDKAREKELIWDGDPAFWARHAPILFPHVGRTFEDVLRIGNRQYASTQHGFARDRVFKADKLGDGQARFTLRHDEETLKKYPFPFVLSVTYTLHPSDVTVQWKVETRVKKTCRLPSAGIRPLLCPKGPRITQIAPCGSRKKRNLFTICWTPAAVQS